MIPTDDSVVVRAVAGTSEVTDTSRVLRAAESLSGKLETAAVTSRSVRASTFIADTVGGWMRGSWLYGWLTAEPEPDVIVVDLRETYTVGPILAILDRVVTRLAPRWRDSAPRRALAAAVEAVVDAPVRIAGWLAVVSLLGSLAVALVRGGTPTGPGLIALGLALLATRERRSADELRETWAGHALAALLVPPDLPEEEAERRRDERRRDERPRE